MIDEQLSALTQARTVLAGTVVKRLPGRPAKATATATVQPKKKRKLTPEGRARIAAAVKARWAKQKKAAKAS